MHFVNGVLVDGPLPPPPSATGVAYRPAPAADAVPGWPLEVVTLYGSEVVPAGWVVCTPAELRTVIDALSPARTVVDLLNARAARKAAIRDELWAHVEAFLDAREREALSALMQRVTLSKAFGVDLDPWATMVLVSILTWAQTTLAQWGPLSAAVDSAVDVAGVDAVVVDTASLGAPPAVSAGALAIALAG